MALYNGLDPVAIISCGNYSKTYGSGDGSNIANLFVSYGLLEDAPTRALMDKIIKIIGSGFKKLIG